VLWFAKILCIVKIARFSAATAVPSRISLHPRAKLEALADVLFGKGRGAILGLLYDTAMYTNLHPMNIKLVTTFDVHAIAFKSPRPKSQTAGTALRTWIDEADSGPRGSTIRSCVASQPALTYTRMNCVSSPAKAVCVVGEFWDLRGNV
jgi:hypothetical protein